LKGGFGAKLSHIGTHKTMGILGDGWEVNIIPQFHILGMDA
jgi:hypothetical protein